MAATILGWLALALLVIGVAGSLWGLQEFGTAHGEAKYGGAMLIMLGVGTFVVGAVLGVIWLAVT